MALDTIRRIAAVIVTLALFLGPVVSGAYAASMNATMTSMANGNMHPDGNCKDCGTQKGGMSASACFGACSGLTALSLERSVLFEVSANGSFIVSDARPISGRADAPDPYPPRTTDLS